MSSRAHSFCRLENRLLGPGAAASLVCHILCWSLKPANSASHSSLHGHMHTGTLWLFRAHTHAHSPTHVYTQMYLQTGTHTCAHRYIVAHMYTDHVNFMCTWLHAETYLNVYTCPCTHVYTQTQTYPCIHMCTRVQTCLHTQMHLHSIAHPHMCRHEHCTCTQMLSIGMYTHLHTGPHSRT